MTTTTLVSKKMKQNKDSIVKDDNGYYKVTLGAINTYNANGIFYRLKDITKVTEGDSIFNSRIVNGILRSEYQHPDFTGMSQRDLINRLVKIDLDRVCAHMKSVEFMDTGRCEEGWDGYHIYIVSGWVKPSGPFAKYLQEALENPDENVSFSIRSAVQEKRVGVTLVRDIIDISTYDFVHEQGVSISSQWNAAGIESRVIKDGNICLDGSCLPKLKGLIKSGTENKDDIERIVDRLDNMNREKPLIFNW